MLCLVPALLLAADPVVKLAATPLDKLPYAAPLVAPGGRCAAVGDAHGWVAVGQGVEGQDGTVSLFRLDAKGRPAAAPVVLAPPRPDHLKGRGTYPLALAFHPTLPLLYVWQDTPALKGDPVPPTDPAWRDFDHLLVYALDGPAPELLLALCRGPVFHTGAAAGALGLDLAVGRLYVPNLRFGPTNPPEGGSGVGWFALAADGLPADESAKGDRAARAAALRAAAAAGKPVGAFAHTPEKTYGFHDLPSGAGYAFAGRDAFLACGPYGPVAWHLADRRARGLTFLMPTNFVVYNVTRLAPHPTLPVVYVSVAGYQYAHRAEVVDGQITLAPQVLLIDGPALRTPPVVLARRGLVAFGAAGGVHLVPIDGEGRFKGGEGVRAEVAGPAADALAYSDKFDLLYVAVEKPK